MWGSDGDRGSDLADGWSLLQWINTEIGARQPWKLTIAEDMHDNEWITKSATEGEAGFGAQWGADFMHVLRRTLTASEDSARDMHEISRVVDQRYGGDAFRRVVYTESHDEVAGQTGGRRLPEAIWPGNADSPAAQKRSTLGAALVLTAPGVPMIFMGQEFLE